jgi:predicted dehydrogenase
VPDFELAGLCVRTPASKSALEGKYAASIVLHYDELLTRDDLDAVIVATPSALHRYIVLDAIRTGKHVLCEAPGIVSELDIEQLSAASQRSATIVQFGHRFWYAPIHRSLADALNGFGQPGKRFFKLTYPESTHLYGIALMLNGPIVAVEAHGKEHACTYDVEFANGDRGLFEPLPGEPDPSRLAERIDVSCGDEKLVTEGGMTLKKVSSSGAVTELARFGFDAAYAHDHSKMADGTEAAHAALRQRGYIPELESFVQSIRTGRKPIVGIIEAGAVFRLVWAMFESVGTGRRMAIKVSA